MNRRPVRNYNLNVIVLNKATISEYYLYSPYTKFAYLYSIAGWNYLCLSKFQTTKRFGDLVECNLH